MQAPFRSCLPVFPDYPTALLSAQSGMSAEDIELTGG